MTNIVKRSLVLGGRRTSVSLEDEFWEAVQKLARSSKTTISSYVTRISGSRPRGANLSSAIRLHVLAHYQRALSAAAAAVVGAAAQSIGGSDGRRDGQAGA